MRDVMIVVGLSLLFARFVYVWCVLMDWDRDSR